MTPPLRDGMDQQQFEAFMADQVAAIAASGIEPDIWIKDHSTRFRAAWEAATRLEKDADDVRGQAE
jgi:hypothetical protein